MKKHLLGLAIFSFIIVSFVSVFAYFYAPREINEVRRPVFETERRNKCNYSKRRIENLSIKITQATLTERYRKFEATVEGEELGAETAVKIHFFVNDGKNTKYLTTKNSQAYRNYNIDNPTAYINFKLEATEQISSKKNNFYVIAELVSNNSKSTDNPQIFDSSKATPVLWEVDFFND